ncbi:cytochrome ubiquinol oxidase subunit I [Bailinhaonella thermotolerans]|uniref:Cytochrome ubiquinol oxidase subunit I n=1 Tax=Bailinhaonella thermotolerans TaxID=1070861 RepID=A0A3A4AQV6_9ACTN|nr:cytochrome ubiquinol oxidase subunit I [Bailinhaonella thermotolerans]RJL23648.1 cytochrome ubiquinol oxidase subunit I [Bailinhaonella thermotolerans]
MDALDLARWQFGVTTVYHFLFVPLTIGLSVLVAGLQTAWHRTGDEKYLRLTKFWGKLFLINFAMGVVTGIVQEFQFGMNWSEYSKFVGDVFGAPLALEGLLAFFLESTFLGLWIFGWDRLPKRIHLATIWCAAIGSNLSAFFILVANAWMRHPVGYEIDPVTGRAEMNDVVAVFTNPTALITIPHVVAGAFLAAGGFIAAISAWHLLRRRETGVFRTSLRLGLAVVAAAGLVSAVTGDLQGRMTVHDMPMKMAAAEGQAHDAEAAGFSVVKVGDFDLRVPYVQSFLATGTLDGRVEGVEDIQKRYEKIFGPGDYRPNLTVVYWSFRFMIAFGMASFGLGLLGLWFTRRRRTAPRWLLRAALLALPAPFAAIITGWILTEMGRQPWTVFGELQTAASVSPGVSLAQVATSLTIFTLLYGALAAVEGYLIVRHVKAGPPPVEPEPREGAGEPAPEPALMY